MDFTDYQRATERTAKYPECGTGSAVAISYVGLGLGEAGEVQGKIKKLLRDDDSILTYDRRNEILDEAGDVLWYIARLATELEADMNEIAIRNINKLMDRRDRGVIGGSGDKR